MEDWAIIYVRTILDLSCWSSLFGHFWAERNTSDLLGAMLLTYLIFYKLGLYGGSWVDRNTCTIIHNRCELLFLVVLVQYCVTTATIRSYSTVSEIMRWKQFEIDTTLLLLRRTTKILNFSQGMSNLSKMDRVPLRFYTRTCHLWKILILRNRIKSYPSHFHSWLIDIIICFRSPEDLNRTNDKVPMLLTKSEKINCFR